MQTQARRLIEWRSGTLLAAAQRLMPLNREKLPPLVEACAFAPRSSECCWLAVVISHEWGGFYARADGAPVPLCSGRPSVGVGAALGAEA